MPTMHAGAVYHQLYRLNDGIKWAQKVISETTDRAQITRLEFIVQDMEGVRDALLSAACGDVEIEPVADVVERRAAA